MFGLSRKVFSGKSKQSRKASYRLQIETLEQRDLLASMGGLDFGGDTEPSLADRTETRPGDYPGTTEVETTGTSTGTWTNPFGGVTGGTTGTNEDPTQGPQPTAEGLALINNLPDATVRSLALATYQDGSISRNDMLVLFKDGSIGYTSLSNAAYDSLKTLVDNGAVVNMPDYVQFLGSQALAGNPNATALKLNVDNFFLGLKRPDADTISYVPVNKPLWNNYPSPQDIYQSSPLRINWLLTGLEEVAWRKRADIMSMFIDNGDNTYTVRFFDRVFNGTEFVGVPFYVTVDNYLPSAGGETFGDTFHSGVLWPALVVKAYAQANDYGDRIRSLDGTWQNSYKAVGLLSEPNRDAYPSWVWEAITGLQIGSGGIWLGSIIEKWSEGHYVALETRDTGTHELLGNGRWYALVNYVPDPAWGGRFTVTQDGKRFIEIAGDILAEHFKHFVATAGTAAPVPTSTAFSLDGSSQSSAEILELAPPTPAVTDLRLAGPKTGIRSVVLLFNKGLDAATAGNLANYRLTIPGRDGRFGTADDRVIPVRLARYNDASHSVTLIPRKRLKLGQFHQISVSGVTDSAGKVLDQDGDGTADSYVRSFARGKRLSYTETDGDRVFLALARRGMMDLTRDLDGEGAQLRLLGTVKRKSVLKGTLKQTNASSDGVSSLALLSRTQGVNIRSLSAATSPIRLDVLDVTVLDATLTTALLDAALTAGV